MAVLAKALILALLSAASAADSADCGAEDATSLIQMKSTLEPGTQKKVISESLVDKVMRCANNCEDKIGVDVYTCHQDCLGPGLAWLGGCRGAWRGGPGSRGPGGPGWEAGVQARPGLVASHFILLECKGCRDQAKSSFVGPCPLRSLLADKTLVLRFPAHLYS